MKLPSDASKSSDQQNSSEITEPVGFETELKDVEQALRSLKERYTQVLQDQQQQSQLQQRLNQAKQEFQQARLPELQLELKQIQDRLDELEVNLESRLFSFGSLREAFWQVVRFGGIGVVIGWLFALSTVNAPKPDSQPAPYTPNTLYTPKP